MSIKSQSQKTQKNSGLVIFHSAKWKIITKQPAPCHVLSKCVLTRATKEADYLLMNFTYQITSIFMAKSLDRARNVYMYLARSNIGRHVHVYRTNDRGPECLHISVFAATVGIITKRTQYSECTRRRSMDHSSESMTIRGVNHNC